MEKIVKWFIYSSENPQNIALTVKGILLLGVPALVSLLSQAGVNIPDTAVTEAITAGVTALASFLTLVGILRKLANTFAGKKVVAFTVPAKLSTEKKKTIAKKKK